MRNAKQTTLKAAAVAVVTFIALGTTSALAATGKAGAGQWSGNATQAYPAQDACMQSPASTTYTPCSDAN